MYYLLTSKDTEYYDWFIERRKYTYSGIIIIIIIIIIITIIIIIFIPLNHLPIYYYYTFSSYLLPTY